MKKQVLFIQGGGEDGYEADAALAASLQKALGSEYEIYYPEIESDESAPDYGWIQELANKISEAQHNVSIVAHSFGASMTLKYLTENSLQKKITGLFLMATPFWDGNEDWQKGIMLHKNFADKIPKEIPLFLYHCRDDEEIPFSHLERYKQKLTRAVFREIKSGGHQLNNDLTVVANDIKSLHNPD
jgi:predicted alpha/beta hydrolase family esterase